MTRQLSEQIAGTVEKWFTSGAADGVDVTPPYHPGGHEVFVETVVPILREGGLFRTGYQERTLRDHFGLPRPESAVRTTVAGA